MRKKLFLIQGLVVSYCTYRCLLRLIPEFKLISSQFQVNFRAAKLDTEVSISKRKIMCVILFKFLPPKISQLYSVEIRIIANKFNM